MNFLLVRYQIGFVERAGESMDVVASLAANINVKTNMERTLKVEAPDIFGWNILRSYHFTSR